MVDQATTQETTQMNDFRMFKVQVNVSTPAKSFSDCAFFSARTAQEAKDRAIALAKRKWRTAYRVDAEIVLA